MSQAKMTTFTNPTDTSVRVSAPPYAVDFEAGETKAVKPALVQACLEARLVEEKDTAEEKPAAKPAAKSTAKSTKG